MLIYNDPGKGNALQRVYKGPKRARYTMTVAGWYGGGFSASSDNEALRIFRAILAREEAGSV